MNLLPYTAGRVFNAPLMIARTKLDTILNVIAPRMQGEAIPVAPPQAGAPPDSRHCGAVATGEVRWAPACAGATRIY